MDPMLVPEPEEPEPEDTVRRAVALALARSGLECAVLPEAYASPWRLAGIAAGAGAVPDTGRWPADDADRAAVTPARRAAGAT